MWQIVETRTFLFMRCIFDRAPDERNHEHVYATKGHCVCLIFEWDGATTGNDLATHPVCLVRATPNMKGILSNKTKNWRNLKIAIFIYFGCSRETNACRESSLSVWFGQRSGISVILVRDVPVDKLRSGQLEIVN